MKRENSPYIYEVPDDRRYWVVRAESGEFYDHFRAHGVVALGHIDSLRRKSDSNIFQPDWADLHEELQVAEAEEGGSKRRASVKYNQVRTFVEGINIGDWVVTVGFRRLLVGRVIGPARYERRPLSIERIDGSVSEMPFVLRRPVVWGPEVKRTSLSSSMIRSFRANQTVFNIDDHWEDVHHLIYPFFKKDGSLYFSLRIESVDAIRNIDVANLLTYFSELEVLSKEFSSNPVVPEGFLERFLAYEDGDQLTLTTKAEFHSPGDIWGAVQAGMSMFGDGWMKWFVMGFIALFGNKLAGFEGLVDVETRREFWKLLIERLKERNMDRVSSRLDLNAPKGRNGVLETDERDCPTDDTD